jgi:predicted ATPase/class 3 adenylate cyclase/Tfp pilus assembly protein PilF
MSLLTCSTEAASAHGERVNEAARRAKPMSEIRALLFTDVVDSTQITESIGDAAMAERWAVHDRLARDLVRTWRGVEIDKSDGLFLMFESARDAVEYAAAYHKALDRLDPPLKARAGIHLGPVILRRNAPEDIAQGAKKVEVDGLPVVVASRLMGIAAGRQTLISAAAYHLLPRDAELRCQSRGHWRLKGISEPLEVYEVDASAAVVLPPDSPKAYRVTKTRDGVWAPVREVPTNVTADRDSFVGRVQVLADLAALFEQGARVVSVHGPGGAGKTRLARRYGRMTLGEYPGGVWFCDLSQAQTIDGVAFASALGLGVTLGPGDPVQQLVRVIAARGRCLMILDNFEQVVDTAEPTLGRWLHGSDEAQFLVTTRARLGIQGERLVELQPLPTSEGLALFSDRASAVQYGYRPDAASLSSIRALVDTLDGLPLAIELAAARIRVMSPAVMLARMNQRFELLKSRTGRINRQSTLRAAFEWSWDLLSGSQKAALAQLSVFRGGFTIEAASRVLDGSVASGTPATTDVVEALADNSLVRLRSTDRFDLMESVREYASERLRTLEASQDNRPASRLPAEERHARYFADEGPAFDPQRAIVELENLVVACRRSIGLGDADAAARTLNGAWTAIEMRGPYRLAVELSTEVRAMAACQGRARAEADLVAGAALFLSGKREEAQDALDSAVRNARAAQEVGLESRALKYTAELQARAGEMDEAAASFDRALKLRLQSPDPSKECSLRNALGQFCEARGMLREAREHYETALQLARATGDRRWEGGSAGNLGQFHANQGRLTEARQLYEQAAAIADEFGNRQWEANTRCNLGLLHLSEGRLQEAETELEFALEASRETGHLLAQATVLCNLGLVADALGDDAKALSLIEMALHLAREAGDRRAQGQFLGYAGLIRARGLDLALARDELIRGEALLRSVGDLASLAILLCARAQAEQLSGNADQATQALRAAEATAAELVDLEADSELARALKQARAKLYTP